MKDEDEEDWGPMWEEEEGRQVMDPSYSLSLSSFSSSMEPSRWEGKMQTPPFFSSFSRFAKVNALVCLASVRDMLDEPLMETLIFLVHFN